MEDYWNNFAQKKLVGKKITSVRYMTKAEAKNMGWDKRPLVIFFNDGSYIFPSMDDEGNDGGAMYGSTKQGDDIIFPLLG
jgi:hypothetical protein